MRDTYVIQRGLGGAVIIVLAACTQQQENPRTNDSVGGLPELVEASSCLGEQAPADFCGIARHHDEIVVGRIQAMEWVYEPAIDWPSGGVPEEAELVSSQECLARGHDLSPRLLITLEDTRYLSGNGPPEFAVMAGTGGWTPFPVPVGAGELPTGVEWDGPQPENQLRVGQTLGVATAYYTVPERHFLTRMFIFNEDGMQTQRVDCASSWLSAEAMAGLTEERLAAELSACETRSSDWHDAPLSVWIGGVPSCSPPYTGEEPACSRNIDCGVGTTCIDGSCR